jgi:hypothetical protein
MCSCPSSRANLRIESSRAQALSGMRSEAETLLAEVDSPADRAVLHLSLGNISRALSDVCDAIAQRDPFLYTINVDPIYDPLRERLEFAQIVQRMFPRS